MYSKTVQQVKTVLCMLSGSAAQRYSSKDCFHYVPIIHFGPQILYGGAVMCGCSFSPNYLSVSRCVCERVPYFVCVCVYVCVCCCQGNDPGDTWTFWKHSEGCVSLIKLCFSSIQSSILGPLANWLVIQLIDELHIAVTFKV